MLWRCLRLWDREHSAHGASYDESIDSQKRSSFQHRCIRRYATHGKTHPIEAWALQCSITMVTACGHLAHCSAQSYVAAMWMEVFPSSPCSKGGPLTDARSSFVDGIARCCSLYFLSASRLPLLKFRFLVCVVAVLEALGQGALCAWRKL